MRRPAIAGDDSLQAEIGRSREDFLCRLLDAQLLNRPQFDRKIRMLHPLGEAHDVNQFVREDVDQERLEIDFPIHFPGFDGAQDAMILQTDAVKVVTLGDGRPCVPDAVVAEHLGECLVANLFGRKLREGAHLVMHPVPFAWRKHVKVADKFRGLASRPFDEHQLFFDLADVGFDAGEAVFVPLVVPGEIVAQQFDLVFHPRQLLFETRHLIFQIDQLVAEGNQD
jgi:hypothetical protein